MFFYGVVPGSTFTTNATPNTENDALFVKSGATRTLYLLRCRFGGKGAGLTSLSGLVCRFKKWTSTASAGGSAITPAPFDPGMQAAKSTAGAASAGVTPGTGGPTLLDAFTCSGSGPNTWDYLNNADSPLVLEGAATQSIDTFVSSGSASMAYEIAVTVGE